MFSDEPAKALAPETASGFIFCDASEALNCPAPATSPLLLARYLNMRTDAQFSHTYIASGVVHYAIASPGTLTVGEETIRWSQGDVVLAADGVDTVYCSSGGAERYGIMEAEPGIEPRYTALQAAA